MNKIREKLVFSIMLIQASACGGIYMYCKMEKWNLEEKMTVFLYPFFAVVLLLLIAGSGFASFCYFLHKIVHAKKIYFMIPFLIVAFFFLLSSVFFNEVKLREYNFKNYQKEREEIVELILQEELTPDESGVVHLPEKLRNEEMARGGCVHIMKYGTDMGIYFCTFSGILDSSAGYIYLTDDIFDINSYNKVVLQDQYQKDWYFCGTD